MMIFGMIFGFNSHIFLFSDLQGERDRNSLPNLCPGRCHAFSVKTLQKTWNEATTRLEPAENAKAQVIPLGNVAYYPKKALRRPDHPLRPNLMAREGLFPQRETAIYPSSSLSAEDLPISPPAIGLQVRPPLLRCSRC